MIGGRNRKEVEREGERAAGRKEGEIGGRKLAGEVEREGRGWRVEKREK